MKYLIILLILVTSLMSASYSAKYIVNVSMFGQVGYIDIVLNETKNKYTMTMTAKTTGTVAALTANRFETYMSKGSIVNGNYIPSIFVKIKKTDHKSKVSTYHFEHNQKKVVLVEEKEKLIKSTGFDPLNFKITKKESIKKTKNTTVLDRYIPDDVLSSFINTTHNLSKQKSYELKAIGAHNDKKDVNLYLLNDAQKEKIASEFSKNIGHICNLNVTPHDKDDTIVDILIGFDDDGTMKEAVLGDIFWIGKVTAKRVAYNSNCEK